MKYRHGYVRPEAQRRLTPKSAFLRALERKQKQHEREVRNVSHISAARSGKLRAP